MEIAERLDHIAVKLRDPCMVILIDLGILEMLRNCSGMVAADADAKVY